MALHCTNRTAEAADQYERAVAQYKELTDQEPANEWYRQERAYFGLALARLLHASGKTAAAIEHCRTSVLLNEQLGSDFAARPHHRERLGGARRMLIAYLVEAGRAEEAAQQADALIKESTAEELYVHAWYMATRADTAAGVADLAVVLAQRSVEMKSNSAYMWTTLGIAHYRAGSWKESIDALQTSFEHRSGRIDGYNGFFLAMARWQLGDEGEAWQWYEQAVEWMEKNRPPAEQLVRYRAEAEQLLQINPQKPATKPESN